MSRQASRQRRTFPIDALEGKKGGGGDGEHSVPFNEESTTRSHRSSSSHGRSSTGSASIPVVSSISSASSRSEHTGIQSTASASGSPSRKHQHRKKGSKGSSSGGSGSGGSESRQPIRTETSLNSRLASVGSNNNERRGPKRTNSITSQSHSVAGTEVSSAASLCLDDLKKSLTLQDNYSSQSQNHYSSHQHFGLHHPPQTPSTSSSSKTKSLTIGHSSNLSSSRSMLHANFAPPSKRNSAGGATTTSSVLPDLFGLEEALHDYDDDELGEGLDKLMAQQMKQHGSINNGNNGRRSSDPSSGSSRHSARSGVSSSRNTPKTPVAWKTPFEVDLPRDTPVCGRNDDDASEADGPKSRGSLNSHLTVEQDAWAGIDALLDMQSVDGSCAISTTDILPGAIVRAMKGDTSRSSVDDDDNGSLALPDDSAEFFRAASKRALESISGENILRKGQQSRSSNSSKGRNGKGMESTMPSLSEMSSSNFEGSGLGGAGAGSLFDVFHWSEKANVDELRSRKKKLNQPNKNRVKIRTSSAHSSSSGGKRRSASKKESSGNGGGVGFSDDCSLPSLSSFQDDDVASRCSMSVASTVASEWDAVVGGGGGINGGGGGDFAGFDIKQVPPINEDAEFNFNDQFGGGNAFGGVNFAVEEKEEEGDEEEESEPHNDEESDFEEESESDEEEEEEEPEFEEESEDEDEDDNYDEDDYEEEDEKNEEEGPDNFKGDGLVLDEGVDRYIQEVQAQLSQAKKGKLAGVLERPSPTSVLAEDEMSAAQELPSLASLANHHSPVGSHNGNNGTNKKGPMKQEKKKDVKLSFSYQLKNSIKKIRDKKSTKSPAGRSEEKYFPEEVINPVTKSSNTKQSLLSQGDDGVNWD